ncbi:MAG: cadherin-like beta sandwich domain-containing protein [Clostridia bacterium]|nr:cadherin-like beta sandwich domain-containing protein [Clostridia bacterium]
MDLTEVKVNSNVIPWDEKEERYYAEVPNGDKPQIVISAANVNQTVQLLASDGSTVLGTGTGTLTKNVTLSEADLTDTFIIRVISHNGVDLGYQDYDLSIKQRSNETGIMYIKVDGSGTTSASDGLTFNAQVSGKDQYPVEIKLKDEKAKVRVLDTDGNVVIADKQAINTGNLAVPDGETLTFKVIVTSENGDEKEYNLIIERISSKVQIDSITVTDLKTDKSGLEEKQVTEYNETTKTYTVTVSNTLTDTTVKVESNSINASVTLDNAVSAKNTVSMKKGLPGIGETIVEIKLTAADGTTENKYLKIIQVPSETGIEFVTVDTKGVDPDETGIIYRAEVNGKDKYPIQIKLIDPLAAVRIDDENGNNIIASQVGILNGELAIPDGEVKNFKIFVTAQDGTVSEYILEIERISNNTNISEITVTDLDQDGNTITRQVTNYDAQNKTYKIVVDKNLQQTTIKIKTEFPDAKLTIDTGETGTGSVTFNKDLVDVRSNESRIYSRSSRRKS